MRPLQSMAARAWAGRSRVSTSCMYARVTPLYTWYPATTRIPTATSPTRTRPSGSWSSRAVTASSLVPAPPPPPTAKRQAAAAIAP